MGYLPLSLALQFYDFLLQPLVFLHLVFKELHGHASLCSTPLGVSRGIGQFVLAVTEVVIFTLPFSTSGFSRKLPLPRPIPSFFEISLRKFGVLFQDPEQIVMRGIVEH